MEIVSLLKNAGWDRITTSPFSSLIGCLNKCDDLKKDSVIYHFALNSIVGDYFIVQDFLLLLITISWWSTQVLYCSETKKTFTLIDLQQPPPTYISFLHTEETTISQIFVTLFFFVTFVTFQVYVRVGKLLKCSYFCFIWLYRPTLNLTYLCKMC